jgi:hypothetical protein
MDEGRRAAIDGLIGALARTAEVAVRGGKPAEAAELFGQAASLARNLLADVPANEAYQRGLGGLLFMLAGALKILGQHDEAIAALTEAEGVYGLVRAADAEFLIADVRLGRVQPHAATGACLSALTDAQAAVMTYVLAVDTGRVDDCYRSTAWTLLLACDYLGAFGEPEVGLAAAREGLRMVLHPSAGGLRLDQGMQPAVHFAATVEAALLRLLGQKAGRDELSRQRKRLARRVPTACDQRLGGARSAQDETVTAVLPAVERITGRDDVLRDLLLGVRLGPPLTPALLVSPGSAAEAGHRAAVAAEQALSAGERAGLRLGVIAHCLLAWTYEDLLKLAAAGVPAARRSPSAEFAAWCRLLATMAIWLEAESDEPMAQDAARRGALVAKAIGPGWGDPAERAALDQAVAVLARIIGPPGPGPAGDPPA